MSSYAAQVKTGTFTAKGVDKTFVLGFKPRLVKVYNVTDRITQVKTDTMDTDKAMNTLANGTVTFVARLTLTSDGFTLLAAAAIDAKELHFEAWQAENE